MNDRPVTASPQEDDATRRAGVIMMALFGVATLLFVCGGAVGVGAAGYNSESAGVTASYIALGPAVFALTGLIASLIAHKTVKRNVWAKVLTPLAVGFFAAPCAVGCLAVFYQAIWPSL